MIGHAMVGEKPSVGIYPCVGRCTSGKQRLQFSKTTIRATGFDQAVKALS